VRLRVRVAAEYNHHVDAFYYFDAYARYACAHAALAARDAAPLRYFALRCFAIFFFISPCCFAVMLIAIIFILCCFHYY